MHRALVMLCREYERRERLREVIAAAYEPAPGPAFCVRRLEVVEHVARTLDIRVLNNDVFADVERAARALGWEPIKAPRRMRGAEPYACLRLSARTYNG